MENYLQEFHCHNDISSRFCASKSTKITSEAKKKYLTLDKQKERESDPAWNNLSMAAEHCRVDEDKTQIELEIAQHLVEESDFNFVKMHFLNHFSDHIRQLANLLNGSSELPEKPWWILNKHTNIGIVLRPPSRFCETRPKWGVSVSRAECKHCNTTSRWWYAYNQRTDQANDENPRTGNQDPWWLAWVVCNANRKATESHCLVLQEICWLHKLCQSGSIFQLSQQRTIHSVQRCSNSGDIFSMQPVCSL